MFMQELAWFFVPGPPLAESSEGGGSEQSNDDNATTDTTSDSVDAAQKDTQSKRPTVDPRQSHAIEHVIMPAVKTYLVAPARLRDDKDVTLLTTLEALYKVCVSSPSSVVDMHVGECSDADRVGSFFGSWQVREVLIACHEFGFDCLLCWDERE